MLTESQKRNLEKKLYKIIKESLYESDKSEKSSKDDSSNTGLNALDNKRQSVLKWLHSDQQNNASIARELWPDMDDDSARSLFSKKLQGHDSKGKPYSFDDDEINDLYNMKERWIEKNK